MIFLCVFSWIINEFFKFKEYFTEGIILNTICYLNKNIKVNFAHTYYKIYKI
jgi:hypothetical protein